MTPEVDEPMSRSITPHIDGVRVVADADESPRSAALEALERARGRPLTDIDRALYEAAEPRAMDRLDTGVGGPPRIAFRYDDYTVTVRRVDGDFEAVVVP